VQFYAVFKYLGRYYESALKFEFFLSFWVNFHFKKSLPPYQNRSDACTAQQWSRFRQSMVA